MDQRDIRVWPMPRGSYTFTQHFGCVPQLGNLYFPGEGCPASAPVIHTGIDLAAPEGTPFYAAASGWVTLADYDRPTADANTRIIIQHDGRNEGYATDYLHWVASYVDEGDYVHAGDPIGEVGNVGFSTGPHLHFSVTDLDTGEFIDPLGWLPDEPGLEGYVSDMPRAQLRLPAGTTAGQPESADPAPHSPPVKEKVPKSPPEDGNARRGRSTVSVTGRRATSPQRTMASDQVRSDPATTRHRRRMRTSRRAMRRTAEIALANETEPESATRTDRDRKMPPAETTAEAAKVGVIPARQTGAQTAKPATTQAVAAKRNPSKEHSGRAARDTERDDASGRDQQSRRDERGANRQSTDQGEPDGGGHDSNHERRRKS